MSQKYTEDKNIALQKLSSGHRLLETVLGVVGIFAFYLMVALISFSPSDPSWSQTAWHGPIHNLGGWLGSWFADTLFFTFGVLAYALPPIMLFFCWSAFAQRDRRDYVDLFGLSLRLIGSLVLLLTSCGLAAINVDDLYYFASGGVIGSLLCNTILPWFNVIGATLALLCVWASGLTLFTGWSWLTIAEKIGAIVLGCLTFLSNHSRRDDEEDAARHIGDDDPLLRPYAAQEAKPASMWRSSVAARRSEAAQISDGVGGTQPGEPAVVAYPQGEQPRNVLPSMHACVGNGASPALADTLGTSTLSPTQADQVLHYCFELLGTPADPYALAAEDDGPRLGDWQRDLDAPHTPHDFTIAQQNSSASLTFMPAFSVCGNDYNPQVKQGIGPELPRPKPVRIPTRRELASYGIKIPSQQRPPLQERQEGPQEGGAPTSGIDEAAAWDEQQRLAKDFAQQQRQRYPGAAPTAHSSDFDDGASPPAAWFMPSHHEERGQSVAYPSDDDS